MSTHHPSLHRHVLKLWLATFVAWHIGDMTVGAQNSAPVQGMALDAWVFKDIVGTDQAQYVIEDDIMRTAPHATSTTTQPAAAAQRLRPRFAEPTFTLFPIPAETFINIKSPMSDLKAIQIIANDGRIMLQQQVATPAEATLSLNIAQLPQGIYYLQLIDQQQKIQSQPFIKR